MTMRLEKTPIRAGFCFTYRYLRHNLVGRTPAVRRPV
jgi:hypothetical protein